MMNVISYDDWKVSCSEIDDFDEIVNVVDKLNFKGYIETVTAIDGDGKPLAAKTRAVNRLSELLDYDFSDCHLYRVEKVNYTHFFVPEGTQPWDYDLVQLSEFENEVRHGYRIRFAGTEKKRKKI